MVAQTTPSFTSSRRWTVRINVLASVAALLAIVVMANFLASRHFSRFRWTEESRYQLSPLTLHLLRSLTNEVRVVVMFNRREPLLNSVTELLTEYELASPMVQVEHVDYLISPGRAQMVLSQLSLPESISAEAQQDRIIFHSNGRTKTVLQRELSEYDYAGLFRGEEVKRTAFRGEQLFTSAIYSVIDPRRPKAYFLTGHGERAPDDSDEAFGYSRFAQLLTENNIEVAQLSLLTDDVPEDCDLLIIAAPRHPIAQPELEKIARSLNQGHRLFALFDFQTRDQYLGLERVLADWGVEVGHNYVEDIDQAQSGEVHSAIVIQNFGNHPIVKPLLRSRLHLLVPRTVSPRFTSSSSADAPRVAALAFTSRNGRAIRAQAVEATGSLPLMVAVEKGNIQGVSANRGSTRMVVAGDALFLGNHSIREGANEAFASLAVNWLLNREVLVEGISATPIPEYKLTMTQSQMKTVRWMTLAVLPGGVVLLGCLVWWRRRS